MHIHEAIAQATPQRAYVRRKAWAYITDTPCSAAIKIQPTNSPDGCIVVSQSAENPRFGWQPREEDLAADDWETVS